MCEDYISKRPYKKIRVKDARRHLGHIGRIRRESKEHGISEEMLRKEWKAVESEKQSAESTLKNNLKKLFENEIALLVKRLSEEFGVKRLKAFNEKATKPQDFNLVVQTLLDWGRWFNLTRDTAQGGVIIVVEEGYKTGVTRSGGDPGDYTLPTEIVQDIEQTTDRVSQGRTRTANVINDILNKAARTQQTFRETAAREIQRGLQEGESMSQIVRRVADKSEEQVGYRLDRIVQTAGNGGFEAGEIEGMKDAGIERGMWLTQRDPRVRSPVTGDLWDHRSADGQESPLDGGWVITGKGGRQETLRFPSDPSGSAGNIIYCRCSIRPL